MAYRRVAVSDEPSAAETAGPPWRSALRRAAVAVDTHVLVSRRADELDETLARDVRPRPIALLTARAVQLARCHAFFFAAPGSTIFGGFAPSRVLPPYWSPVQPHGRPRS